MAIHIHVVKPAHAVTSIKQSLVLKGTEDKVKTTDLSLTKGTMDKFETTVFQVVQ
jgi:hypothetical protein